MKQVMQGGHNNIYLGMPSLCKNSAVLAFYNSNENSLCLIIGVLVIATQHLEIVPYTETVVPGVLQIPVSQSSQGYCYPIRALMSGDTTVTAHDSVIPVQLLNCQPFKIQVNKGE